MRRIILTIILLAVAMLPHGAKAQLTIPYAENFDTMTNISSFTAQGFSYYGCMLSLTTSASCNSTKQLRFYSGSSNKNRVLVFPAFNEPINGLTLVFNTRPEGTSITPGYFDVGYVTDASDTSTFVALMTYHCISFNNACQLKECRFASAPAGARIAMRNRTRGTNYYWYVDDIEVLDTMGLCHWPTSLEMTDISSTSVTLAAADSTESTDNFRLVLDGTDMGVFYNQTTVNGLAPNSNHTAIVRSICSNDSSSRTLTYNFTTRCNNTVQAPFFDNMESYASQSEPDCYTTIVGSSMASTIYPRVFRNANTAYSDTGYLRLQGLCNVITMPTIDLSANQMHVKFYMRYSDTTQGILRAGVLTTLGDTASFVPLFTVPNHSTQYNEYEFWTDDITTNTAYVTFYWTSRYAKAACFIDDITVEEAVGCRKPNQTYIDSVDSTSVSLRWNNVSVASSFQLCYNTSNDTTTATIVSGITSNTYTATGLAPATDYWFWVRTVCDDTTSWQPIGSTRTQCLSGLYAPVNITFDSLPQGSAPRCWTTMNTPSYVIVVDEQYFGFGRVLQFSPGYGSSTVIAMPHIHLPANNMRVTVTAAVDAMDPATLELGYVTDLASPTSFVPLVNVSATTLTNYTFDTDTIYDDTLWIAFRSASHAGQVDYAYISAINISPINGCHKPVAVSIDSISDIGASVRWNSTDAMYYELALAPVPDIDSAWFYTSADTSYSLTGLLPSTHYYVWIRSYCGNEYSEWTSPEPFTTMCDNGYCTINMHLVDNDYNGQLFNYAYVGVIAVVNGVPVALAGGPGTPDSVVDVSFPVCSTDSVAFIWIDTSLYESYGIFSSIEYSFTTSDGTILASGNGAGMYHGNIMLTTTHPCPSCPTPTMVMLDNTLTTDSSLTVTWAPTQGSSEWIVSLNGTILDTVSDTLYTFSGLAAGTAYTLGVATLCDFQVSSQPTDIQAVTACAGSECEMQVDMSTLHEYNVVWGGGNAVEVYAGNSLRGSVSVPNGSEEATVYIPVCDGDSLTLLWHAGTNMYGSYCAFTAINPGDDTIYSGTGSSTSTIVASAVVHCNSCLRPDSINVVAVGNTSATFSWHSTGATSYRLAVNDTVIIATDTTATVTGLTPSTTYTYLIQACCADGNSLASTGIFATACGPRPLPYFEDFEDTPRDQVPLCWTTHNQYPDYMGAITPSVYRGSSRARSGYNSLELASNGHYRPMAVSPALTGAQANKLHIRFWLNGATHTGFEAGIMTNPQDTTTFIPLFVRTQATLNYTGYQFTTESATITDSIFYFALRYTSTLVMYNDIFLDDVFIRRIPDCTEEFNNINILSVGDSSVSVTWDVGPGDNIDAYYTVVILNANGDIADSINTNNDTLTIDNLPSATSYLLYVKLMCGGTASAVSDTITFTTLNTVCATPSIDSTIAGEDYITVHFSDVADTTEIQLTADNGIEQTVITVANNYTFDNLTHSTTYSISLRAHCGSNLLSDWVMVQVSTDTVNCGTPTNLAVSDITFSSATISWIAGGDESAWNIRVFNNFYDSIYYSTTTSIFIEQLVNDVEYTVQVQALCGSHSNIPGDWSEPLVFNTEYCMPVSNVTVSNIDATSAEVSWEPGGNGNGTWQVEYGPAGFSRGEGLSQFTDTSHYIISGLHNNSTYDVYVATVCNTDNISVFSDVVTFTTGEQGINDVSNKTVMLYPNPTSEAVTVLCNAPAKLTIIDQSGRTVLSTTIATSTSVVNLDELPRGAYFVRLLNSQGSSVHKLIVK